MAEWKWCLEENGVLLKGWQLVGDYWYYLDQNGSMKTGWYEDSNGKWYYLEKDGKMATGWKLLNDKWYYLYKSTNEQLGEYIGTTAYSCSKKLEDGKTYTFDSEGVWVKNDGLLSDSGADFIGSWEGFWSQAKYDPYYPNDRRYITIGYGTTYEAMPNAFNSDPLSTTCTVEDARKWLKDEALKCSQTIKNSLDSNGVTLNQNEMDACVSFAYNCGTGALLGSTFWKNVIAGVRDASTITTNLQAWSKANGVTSSGLLKRRNSEANLFLNGDYTGNN